MHIFFLFFTAVLLTVCLHLFGSHNNKYFITNRIYFFLFTVQYVICPFTISSRKYFPVYFDLGPRVCQFIHMDKPNFYLAFQLPCLNEWREKLLETQNTNESASTHAVSEMISFNIFPSSSMVPS